MGTVRQVFGHRFPNLEQSVATLNVPVHRIAARFGFTPEAWEEDEVGPATGFCMELASGRVLLLRELEQAAKLLGAQGPTVWADIADFVELGTEELVKELLEGLGLPPEAVDWKAGKDAESAAAEILAKLRS
jgi:hypothetical protein